MTDRTWFFAALCLGLAGTAVPVDAQVQPQVPRFQSSIEVTSIDAVVVDDRSQPVMNLQPGDFAVKIDGDARRVVTAEWVPLTTPERRAPAAAPEGFTNNENATGGRLIVIAVDQPNMSFGAGAPISRTIGRFLDSLEPSDRVAAVGLGQGGFATPFTADHERIKLAISRMTGRDRRFSFFGTYNISMSEGVAISHGDAFALMTVISRECEGLSDIDLERCAGEVQTDAIQMGRDAEIDGDDTLQSLRALLAGLRAIEGSKTLVLLSQGFLMREQTWALELGTLASSASTSIYVLKLDEQYDVASTRSPSPFSDRLLRNEGLEALVSASRGSLLNLLGDGTVAFNRLRSELSGYYLLGVESDPKDKDGRPHSVNVSVSRRGAVVRSRRQIMAMRDEKASMTRQQVAISALSTPLLISALPLRVATFSLLGPEQGRIQLLIHADVGTDYASPKAVSVAYIIADGTGRIVESQASDTRLLPVMTGVPSPLQLAAGASLPPGDYMLKLAVAEGDRVGTVEHPIHARLEEANTLKFSELMVGGPASLGELLQPTVGYQVTFGTVHGYVEVYGQEAKSLSVKYEVAPAPSEASLVTAEVTARPAGDERTIFSLVMPIRQLPPGKYYLRAVVSDADREVKTLTRPFEIAPPAVLMTSAEGTGTPAAAPGEVFLPVPDEVFVRPFRREDVVRDDTMRNFRAIVNEKARATFEKGAALLSHGDYVNAEQSFKDAIGIDAASTGALAYLAATYAASGHDIEAANAWQTALIDGSDVPQIYEWLGDALLRNHELAQARTVLEEAASKWPGDVRFALPLAVTYATFGQGREAVRTLERHLGAHSDDHTAQAMGVEWIYHLRASGAAAHTPAEDVKLARSWADAYAKSKGPQAGLVRQWLQFVERGSRP